MNSENETCVLIVGGGPVGLTAAIELGWRGIPAILVTEKLETAQHPKCNSTNARSMEHFRRLGIAKDLRAAALPPHIVRASAYVTRFCGYEFGRLPRSNSDWPTPEIPNNVSQIVLEKRLRAHAERQPGVQVNFGLKLVSFESGSNGIATTVESTSGEQRRIEARYMIAADGASSTVRRTLGIGMVGEDGTANRAFMGGTMLSYYVRSPGLIARSGRVPTHSTWIINPEMRGLMFSQDGKEHWVAHYQVPPGVDWRTLDDRAIVRKMLGCDEDFEIISGGPWTGGLALVADRYQSGNIFLAGDAAHLFTPLGGMGMNTGIGDIMNICWKIAAAEEGWAGPHLLASYEIERRPIGLRNSQFGVKCSRVMDGWIVPDNFEDDTPEAQKARATLGAQVVVEDVPQYLSAGLQLGERYETSPIVFPARTPAPEDRWDVYVPLDRPGARAPHFWVTPDQSLYDCFGKGFTLLAFGPAPGAAVLGAAAAARHLPLKTLRFEARNDLYGTALVLVRPDEHIAWQGDDITEADAIAVIDRVRGAGSAKNQ
jgi:2-polyprenyl-6-methoxyphenol hydroxylase-like FAD-dependent oxidoreductase